MRRLGMLIPALMLSGILMWAVVSTPPRDTPAPVVARMVPVAPQQTGATNLVSAIYLGYRAYDTLGEALVLLLAVAGIYYFSREQAA